MRKVRRDAATQETMTAPDHQVLAIARALGGDTHRITLGLRPLDTREWIEDGPDLDAQLHEKRRLLDERSDLVAALPDNRDAQREVLSLLSEHLPQRFPERYRREQIHHGEHLRIDATGESIALRSDDPTPIAAAARLVPEDLCLMRASPEGYRLVAAALCFPTRWRLADKLGQPMLAIHTPVPGYAAAIGAASDGVMAALDAARPVWRANWSLLDSPALYQPQRLPQPAPAVTIWANGCGCARSARPCAACPVAATCCSRSGSGNARSRGCARCPTRPRGCSRRSTRCPSRSRPTSASWTSRERCAAG